VTGPETDAALPAFARGHVNLADAALGAEALDASDDFFADKARMLQRAPAVFVADKYDAHGKWMDGWESRRRRGPGHDWCIVRLAMPGRILGVDIDTSFFTGNFPPAASLDGCPAGGDPERPADWIEILPASALGGDRHHHLAIHDPRPFGHVRLNIHPDGGVARLRVYGLPWRDWSAVAADDEIDLAALVNGGRILGWSDAHYGDPFALLAPGRSTGMQDGWETRRRREPGHDWIVIALCHAGTIARAVVDTAHFKGNYPDRCSLLAARLDHAVDQLTVTQSMFWPVLLPEQTLGPDREHLFGDGVLQTSGPVTHVRLNAIPDGGISRLRLFGRIAR
jgi:allantoicase